MTLPLLRVDLGPGVRAAFTRTGLVPGSAPSHSGAPFNLSVAVGDDEEVVRRRRRSLEEWIGAPVAFARQVHGAHVHVCGAEPATLTGGPEAVRAAFSAPVATADALLVRGPAPAVGVLVADCVPVLLADGAAGVVGAVHAGRRGLVAGVVPAAVAALADLGATRLSAVVGPAICGSCYEVPAAVRSEVADVVPGTASTTRAGTPALDLPGGVRRQLADAGVEVTTVEACTLEDPGWFSHRGVALGQPVGRCAAVVRVV